jgi:hypothetical protein
MIASTPNDLISLRRLKKYDKPCKFYKKGICRKGINCNYEHFSLNTHMTNNIKLEKSNLNNNNINYIIINIIIVYIKDNDNKKSNIKSSYKKFIQIFNKIFLILIFILWFCKNIC